MQASKGTRLNAIHIISHLYSYQGSFTLRDSTMRYQPHDSLITFNTGLGALKTKSGGGFMGGGRVGDVFGGDFVLRGPNPFLKSDETVMCLI